MTLSIPLFPISISINDKNRQKSTCQRSKQASSMQTLY